MDLASTDFCVCIGKTLEGAYTLYNCKDQCYLILKSLIKEARKNVKCKLGCTFWLNIKIIRKGKKTISQPVEDNILELFSQGLLEEMNETAGR